MELFEERCSGGEGIFVKGKVREREYFPWRQERDNGDSVNVEVSGELVAGVEACKCAILEVGSDVKFLWSCV